MVGVESIGLHSYTRAPSKQKSANFTYVPNSENINGQILGAQTTITFVQQTNGKKTLTQDSFLMGSVQLRDSVTNQPYPTGTPIALNPDFMANLVEHYVLQYGNVTIDTEPNASEVSTFLMDIFQESHDYNQGQQGLMNALILDDPGQTQYSATIGPGNAGAPGIAGYTTQPPTNDYIFVDFTVNGVAYVDGVLGTDGSTLYFVPPSNFPSSTVIPAGTLLTLRTSSGYNITQGYIVIGGVNNYFAGFSSAAVTAGNQYGIIATFETDITGTAGTQYTLNLGTSQSLFNLYTTYSAEPNPNYFLTMTVAAESTATDQSLITIVAPTEIPDAFTDEQVFIQPPLFNTVTKVDNQQGFWARQALTDNGKFFNFRIPLTRCSSKFLRWNKIPLIGEMLTLTFYISPTSVASMVMRDPVVNPPNIIMNEIVLVLRQEEPPDEIIPDLRNWLSAGIPVRQEWLGTFCQTLQPIPSGSNTFIANITMPINKPEAICFAFIPTAFISNSGLVNPRCSLVPAGTQTSFNNPIINGTFGINGITVPMNKPYGSNRSDAQREFYEFLKIADRLDSELLSPILNFNSFLSNYFFLTFDLSGLPSTQGIQQNQLANVNVTFAQPFAQQITPYYVVLTQRHTDFKGVNGRMMAIADAY